MSQYNNDKDKIFYVNGTKYKSQYVSEIRFTGDFEYGYVNIIFNSGSQIHLSDHKHFINFLYDQEWLKPCTTH